MYKYKSLRISTIKIEHSQDLNVLTAILWYCKFGDRTIEFV